MKKNNESYSTKRAWINLNLNLHAHINYSIILVLCKTSVIIVNTGGCHGP